MFSVRGRLAVMMFLQYFVLGRAWAVEMGGYMGSTCWSSRGGRSAPSTKRRPSPRWFLPCSWVTSRIG